MSLEMKTPTPTMLEASGILAWFPPPVCLHRVPLDPWWRPSHVRPGSFPPWQHPPCLFHLQILLPLSLSVPLVLLTALPCM